MIRLIRFLKPNTYNLKPHNGFTLIELLVAIALFSVVVSIAVGGFVRALRTQRQVVALIAANSNASLVIEQIAREVRTGVNFSCIGAFQSGGSCGEMQFINAEGDEVIYRFTDQAIQKGENGSFRKLTGENVSIQYLFFRIPDDPLYPPRITISIGVSAKIAGISPGITRFQTTVSARQF